MRGFFNFEGTPSFLKKYQKGTPRFLIAVPQPQVILERRYISAFICKKLDGFRIKNLCNNRINILQWFKGFGMILMLY